ENYLFMDVHNMEAYVKYNYFHKEQHPRYTPNPFCPASLYYNKEQDFYFSTPLYFIYRIIRYLLQLCR
ncbi:hypothetical protein, partial [Prevotella veroralis]